MGILRLYLSKIKNKIAACYSKLLWLVFRKKYKQLIVCGYPRSGTSLIYNMLSTSLEGFKFNKFEILSIYRIHRLGNIATKSPMDIFNINNLLDINIHKKELIVIIMIRDIRDIITSKHPLFPDEYFIGYDHSWWPQDANFNEWDYDGEGIKAIYDEINRLSGETNVKIIRYENLIAKPDEIQEELRKEFGLCFSAKFSDFYKNQDRIAYSYKDKTAPKNANLVRENKKVDQTRKGKWKQKEHRQRIWEQFNRFPEMMNILISYGYEENENWYVNEYHSSSR